VLASASPRREALLRRLGLAPEVVASEIPEQARPAESPRALVLRLAEAKGRSVVARLAARAPGPPCVVLAADTEVVLDGQVLGKPCDDDEAARMLRALAGRTHEVLTAVFLLRTDSGRAVCEVEQTDVRFHAYDEPTIAAYVASGEGRDKAGGYAIQGQGARLAQSVDGSFSNVVGLPVERLQEWLARIDVDLDALRGPRADLRRPSE
jgi:septum formation protein